MNICTSCGNQNNPPGAKFCSQCGSPLEAAAPAAAKPREREVDLLKAPRPTRGRGPLARILLGIGGIIGLFSFIQPFYVTAFLEDTLYIPGIAVLQAGLDYIKITDSIEGHQIIDTIGQMLTPIKMVGERYFKLGGILLLLIGPLAFGVVALFYFLGALRGRRYMGGFSFGLVYTALGLGIFFITGQELDRSLNFFHYVGSGYWGSMVCLLLARISAVLK